MVNDGCVRSVLLNTYIIDKLDSSTKFKMLRVRFSGQQEPTVWRLNFWHEPVSIIFHWQWGKLFGSDH